MAVKSRSTFEKVAIAWLCFSIAALLAPSYLRTVPGVSSTAIETVPVIGFYSALSIIAILLVRKVSVIGTTAGKLFFVALGYLWGLVIRASKWIRKAFGLGTAAALRDESASGAKDDSSAAP